MIKDFVIGDKIEQPCIVRLQKIGTSSNGKAFARGLLEDNTGCLPFICFETGLVNKLRDMEVPKPFVVGGNVDVNKFASDMSLQIILQKLENIGAHDDITHLMPSGDIDLLAYQKKLDNLIADIKEPGLAKLVKNIFSGETYEQFLINPAGMRLHHAYVGGLMHHTVCVANIALALAHTIEGVDRDLVLAGALLHDVGKLKEISPELGFPYTTEGRLLGHISIMGMLVKDEGSKIQELTNDKLQEVLHIILSHHGEQDKGSPVACATKESFVVHYADEIDAIMNQFNDFKKKDSWEYNKMLQRYLYNKA